MARIIAGIATSHVPAIGAAIDLGKTGRALLAAGVQGLRVLETHGSRDKKPDVVVLVYNDHATAFSLEVIPTFAIGCAERVRARRRRLGAAAGARWSKAIRSSPGTSRSR